MDCRISGVSILRNGFAKPERKEMIAFRKAEFI